MNKPVCTFLVGLPASGKTTWLENNIFNEKNVICLSTDNIIEDISAQWGYTYNQSFSTLISFAEKVFLDDLFVAWQENSNIYIDRTNLSVKSRKRIMDRLPGYEFKAIVFPKPEKLEWEKRLNSRPGKNIPADALIDMEKKFILPTYEEDFTEISLATNGDY